jgi:hypothetical protein
MFAFLEAWRDHQMSEHQKYKFSVTIHTDDLAIVGCLRALSKFSQKTGNNQIPWGGTKGSDWKRAGNKVTFHFSAPQYRAGFLAELKRLLPGELWSVAATSDDHPARPQR